MERVVDGDTIVVDIGGRSERVRYIGLDAPESVRPDSPVEPLAREASAANARLVGGRSVVLEKDISETDRHGRLLRYVWLRDGDAWQLVTLELLRLGLAEAVRYPPDVKYMERYLEAQSEAREARRGIWGAPVATAAAVTMPPIALPPSWGPRAGCDAAYPDVCIAPPPPDLDCGDVPFRGFRVRAPDPHRFDGGGDGLGCERG